MWCETVTQRMTTYCHCCWCCHCHRCSFQGCCKCIWFCIVATFIWEALTTPGFYWPRDRTIYCWWHTIFTYDVVFDPIIYVIIIIAIVYVLIIVVLTFFVMLRSLSVWRIIYIIRIWWCIRFSTLFDIIRFELVVANLVYLVWFMVFIFISFEFAICVCDIFYV